MTDPSFKEVEDVVTNVVNKAVDELLEFFEVPSQSQRYADGRYDKLEKRFTELEGQFTTLSDQFAPLPAES
jgi:hypothetical protein